MKKSLLTIVLLALSAPFTASAGTLAWDSEINTSSNQFAIKNLSVSDGAVGYLIDHLTIQLSNGLIFDTVGGAVVPQEKDKIQYGTLKGEYVAFNGLPSIPDESTSLTLNFNQKDISGNLLNFGFQTNESWGMLIDFDDISPSYPKGKDGINPGDREDPVGANFNQSLTITVYFNDTNGFFRGSVAATFGGTGGGVSIPLFASAAPITPPPNPVPEPATMFLLGSGIVGLAGIARRRKK